MTLSISGAVPLIVVKTSSVYVGGLIAIGLVIFILTSSILTMLKTKRKVDSSNDSLSEYQSEIIINKNTLENIWTTEASGGIRAKAPEFIYNSEDGYIDDDYQVDVHNNIFSSANETSKPTLFVTNRGEALCKKKSMQ